MAFASHEAAHGQQERRGRVGPAAQRRFIGGIVGLAKRLVRQLFLLMVVIHGAEHLVVHPVQHGFAVPIFGWTVPLLEFTARRFGDGHGHARVFHARLFVLGVVAAGEQNGEVVGVLPRGCFVVLGGEFHALALTDPTPVERRHHRCDVFLHPEVFLGGPTHERQQGVDNVHRFDLMKSTEFGQRVFSVGPREGHGRFEPGDLEHTHAGLLWRRLFVRARDDGHIMASLGQMTREVVDHGADASPPRRILARDHGDVH